jgi:hypothetical protein
VPDCVSCSAVLYAWTGLAFALVRTAKAPTAAKKKVVSNVAVTGPSVKCHQWGFVQVQLKLMKTEVTSASVKPQVSIKITAVSWPVYPTHTPKSVYINAQALPFLQQETLQAALAKALTP